MKENYIILVGGKKRSGKDKFTDTLIKTSKNKIKKLSFATALKECGYNTLNLSFDKGEQLKNDNIKYVIQKSSSIMNDIYNRFIEEYSKIGYLLNTNIRELSFEHFEKSMLIKQSLTEDDNHIYIDIRKWLQHIGSSMKVLFNDNELWAKIIYAQMEKDKNYIISDFRFPYEKIERLTDKKIITIKIIGKNYYDVDEYDLHDSETALNEYKFDYHINNTIYYDKILQKQSEGLLHEIRN